MEHANLMVQILLPLFSVIIIAAILVARRKNLFIRRIQGLTAIDEAIGRATEMGRPMLCSIGLQGLTVPTLQALAITSYIVRNSARFGTRAIVPVAAPEILPVAQEAVREAYTGEGYPEQYNADDVRFLSGRQFAFAASVSGILVRERVAATFYFGTFFAEALIFAETGNQVGAIQVAGTPSTSQIPFFIAACDYVIIGDEFYAASAYLSREPTLLGSLVGQDIAKGVLIALVVVGAALASLAPVLGQAFVKFFTG
ncbi:MAG TPA: DUF6754 domain-containing protein [Chthonomonadaceae bacterium]|nr:DUF6754 domain-containing protein [Chthonomonadaceae bacterium]